MRMRVFGLLQFSLWAAGVVCVDPNVLKSSSDIHSHNHGDTRGSRRFIVEVEPGASAGKIARQVSLKAGHNKTLHYQFDCSDIFSGFSIESETENADSLRRLDGVVNVWSMRVVPKSWVRKEASFTADTKLNYSMHQWTGVDKLHAKGIRGKGVTVAVIDTGVDYTHKALGGCFGAGCKIAGGYDLVGADWDMRQPGHFPKKPDADPMDYEGHGTHVAGIIAADNDWLTGVAPDSRLLVYKVFSDTPWETDEETLIQSFCDAYGAGADVITASIGQPNGFSDNPWALVASRIVKKGIVVTIAAGNEGDTGPLYSSSGSNGHGVLSVAAVNVTGHPYVNHANRSWDPIPAYFTTWGPTNELLLKPDIAAPGWDVVSTVLNQSYEAVSGTSMSAPYIAGIAALYIGEYGGREVFGPAFAKMLGDRIKASGKSLPWTAETVMRNHTVPPLQVGTGLVDAWKVLKYDTQLEYESFALLDTELFKPRWKVNITNNDDKTHRYSFKLEPQSGVQLYDTYFGVASLYYLKPQNIVPPVRLPRAVEIEPGMTKEVEFLFGLPDVDDDYRPLYGGKVWIKSDSGERLSIAYGGAAYDTEKEFDTMFTTEPYIPPQDGSYSYVNVNNHELISPISLVTKSALALDMHSTSTVVIPSTYPSKHIYHTPVTTSAGTWEFPPTIGEAGYIGSATTMRDSDEYWFYGPETNDKYDTIPFPLHRVPRGYQSFWWFGVLANGTRISPGNYTVRFAALRPYGNPNISDHWDIMQNRVPNIQIRRFNETTTNSTLKYRWKESTRKDRL